MKKFVLALCGSVLSCSAGAENTIRFGAEIDAIPYLLNGYYGSVALGIERWQLRLVTTRFETPDFYLQSGFEHNEVKVNAAIIDYYFNDDQHGFWLGAGIESWRGDVVESSSLSQKSYATDLATFGGGYAYYLTNSIYLNPWVGVHIPVRGVRHIDFLGATFDVKTTAEVSVKLGVKF